MNNAYDSSAFAAGDSAALCASHSIVSGGTVSNVLSTAADLNETSLEQAVIDIAAFTDDRGLAADHRRTTPQADCCSVQSVRGNPCS